MKYPLLIIALLIFNACGGSDNDDDNNNDTETPIGPTSFEAVEISNLASQLIDGYVMAFEKPSMTVGYVELASTEISGRPQTTSDEVFFIYDGSGTITVGETEQEISKGEAVIVQGSLASKLSTTSNLQVVVVTLKENGFAAAGGFKHYSTTQISSKKSSNANGWNPFIQQSNVLFGLYSLPQSLGGDQTLTHTWEELNIVTSGSSRFSMGDQTVNVKRGSIVFVNEGIGHFFDQLNSSIDIMILWEQ